MLKIKEEEKTDYTYLGLFSGAGGLDLGFEKAGFIHTESSDILDCAVNTLRCNRPEWNIRCCDVREYTPSFSNGLDVLLAGFPCQGFSLGGNRDVNDSRNSLYKEVVRITKHTRPRVVVMENVLNLRTMINPESGLNYAEHIAAVMESAGYKTKYRFFRVSKYGVPQTRRRFIFICCRDNESLDCFQFPQPSHDTSIRKFIYDLGQDLSIQLPNHDPKWGFESFAHKETGEAFPDTDIALPVRFSRTASVGTPIRTFDEPFPAIDTATVWGWALGNVKAHRIEKDRSNALFVRDPNSSARLWRITASKLRPFTAREYARLQTFPDDWIFTGTNKREIQLQIGNAVPVIFAKKIANCIKEGLEVLDGRRKLVRTEALELSLAF